MDVVDAIVGAPRDNGPADDPVAMTSVTIHDEAEVEAG